MAKKTKKIVVTPRDYMESTPVFKFPPMPTNDYMVVYRSVETGMVFAEPVDFIAVCEYSTEIDDKIEIYEGICFLVFENDGGGFFEIISPNDMCVGSNRLGVVKTDTLYWYDEKTKESAPIYKWDDDNQAYVHPIAVTINK